MTVAEAKAQYIAALEAILAADPIIGTLVPERATLRHQLALLKPQLLAAPDYQKPGFQLQMSTIQQRLFAINNKINNTGSGDVQDAVKALRDMRV